MPPRECTVHSCPNVKELLSQNSRKVSSLSDCNEARTQKHLVRKRTLNPLSKMAKWLNCVASSYLYSAFDCLFLSCHEHFSGWTTLYSFLTVKELLARNRHKIWSLNDCNGIRIQNNLVRQLTLDHLAKLDKWSGCVASSYLYSGFDCIFLIMWCMPFRVNPHSIVARMSRKFFAPNRRKIWSLSDYNGTRTHDHLVRQLTLNHFAKLAKWFSCVVSTYLYGAFDCKFLSCTCVFQSESTLYSCLN